MEPPTPLSLSVLSPLLIFASCSLAIFTARRWKNVIVEPVVGKEVNRYEKHNGTKIFIPKMLTRWPWHRQINPNYSMLKKESDAWINSFGAFSAKAQDALIRCDPSLLACLAYPAAKKVHARSGCDLMHLLFMIDEYSDRSEPSEVRKQKDIILDALRNPHVPRPKGEWVGGEIARQFWELTKQNTTTVAQKRFVQNMDEYLEGVVHESIDKKDRRILDIKTYIDVRRHTSAVKPSFSMIELGLDIPDEVMFHPTMQEIVLAAGDIVFLHNDICSYNLEQHRGDDLHNIITCVMNEHNTDVNGAMLWVEDYILKVEENFYAALAGLPRWEEPLNSQVRQYCEGLGQWVRANDEWSFESERYLGRKGPEIKEKRWMSLLPKQHATEIGPVHIDSSLL